MKILPFLIVSFVLIITGCGMLMSDEDIAEAEAQKQFLKENLAGMDPALRAEAEAAIVAIDKRISEGETGWGWVEVALGIAGGFFPPLALLAANVKKSRSNLTGVFDIIELSLGESDKFDKTTAAKLMDQHPSLRAQFDAWKAARAAAEAIA